MNNKEVQPGPNKEPSSGEPHGIRQHALLGSAGHRMIPREEVENWLESLEDVPIDEVDYYRTKLQRVMAIARSQYEKSAGTHNEKFPSNTP